MKATKKMAPIKVAKGYVEGRCLLIPKHFCTVYDYAGKADLSNPAIGIQKEIGGNHAFYRDI